MYMYIAAVHVNVVCLVHVPNTPVMPCAYAKAILLEWFSESLLATYACSHFMSAKKVVLVGQLISERQAAWSLCISAVRVM